MNLEEKFDCNRFLLILKIGLLIYVGCFLNSGSDVKTMLNNLPILKKEAYKLYPINRLGGPGNQYHYVPELDKWVSIHNLKRKLQNSGIDVNEWRSTWYPKRITTEEELLEKKIESIISDTYRHKYRHTKDYIRKQLRIDINYTCDFLMVREDFIEKYYQTRMESGKKLPILSYDFSKSPEFIIDQNSKFVVYCTTINPKTDKPFGYCKTSYKKFITGGVDPIETRGYKKSLSSKISQEEFIRKSKKKFGNRFDYSKVAFIDLDTPITLICNDCGSEFQVIPRQHLYSLKNGGCNTCAALNNIIYNRWSNEEFITRAEAVHGKGTYDYSLTEYINMTTPIKVICKIHGVFTIMPYRFLNSGTGCPYCRCSSGELMVFNWLRQNGFEEGIDFLHDRGYVPVNNDTNLVGKNSKIVRIDFQLTYEGKIYWIEYNGEQHYFDYEFFRKGENSFEKCQKRDNAVKDYCKNNNIIFIEIPYTYNIYKDISKILSDIIFDKLDPADVINLDNLKKL